MRRALQALLLGLTLVLTTCTPSGTRRYDDPIEKNDVTVQSFNWWATSVEWYCNGTRIWTIHGLDLGAKQSVRIRLWACSQVQFVIRGRGGARYESEPFIVPQGSTVRVEIPESLHLTVYYLRSYAEEGGSGG